MLSPPARYYRRLLLTEAEFSNWLTRAEPSDQLEYHRGFLALDVLAEASRLPDHEQAELSRLVRCARSAWDRSLVHLVQRRHGYCDYSYFAVLRPSDGLHERGAAHV